MYFWLTALPRFYLGSSKSHENRRSLVLMLFKDRRKALQMSLISVFDVVIPVPSVSADVTLVQCSCSMFLLHLHLLHAHTSTTDQQTIYLIYAVLPAISRRERSVAVVHAFQTLNTKWFV